MSTVNGNQQDQKAPNPLQNNNNDGVGNTMVDAPTKKENPGKEVQIVEKIVYVPQPDFETKLMNALSLYGAYRPINRLEVEEEDVTKEVTNIAGKVKQTVQQISQMSPTTGGESFDDGLGHLFIAKKAYIDQYYEIKDFFVICPLNFKYHISLDLNKPGAQPYHLFDIKDFSPNCGRDFCPNQARKINIDLNSIPLNQTKTPKRRFASLEKPFRCSCLCLCACCTRPQFTVKLAAKEETIGRVVELRTLCNPVIAVYDINNQIDWNIKGSYCQNGYCCRDFCLGKCSECEFDIYCGKDVRMTNTKGKIKKRLIYGHKLKPDVDQIEIIFPPEATAKEKVTLIAAGLMVEYLYFQNGKNHKRCHE